MRTAWRRSRRATAGILTGGLLVVACSGWLNTVTSDPRYQFSAMLNPLSTMLQHPLRSPELKKDFAAIDTVVDIEKLRALPLYTETPSLNLAWAKQDPAGHAAAFRAAYVDLVVHNPGPFLQNRWSAFLAANSMQPDWAPQVQVGGINGSNPAWVKKFTAFEASTPFASAWDLQLKYQTARHLFLLDSTLRPTIGTTIIWNAIPAIAVLLITLIWAAIRRRWTTAVCSAVLVGSAALVFLAEPASYFMYFFPVYLAGLTATATALARTTDHLLNQRHPTTATGFRRAPQESLEARLRAEY